MNHPLLNIALLLLLLIYTASARKMWKYYHNSYGKGGQWSSIKATSSDVFFTYCPFANTIAALCEWKEDGTERTRLRNQRSYNHVFNIEDEEKY